MRRDQLTMGDFDNLDNKSVKKIKKSLYMLISTFRLMVIQIL
jgi:hypothetical protein